MRQKNSSQVLTIQRFQSTHPLRDATYHSSVVFRLLYDFNPRTPYGMRRIIRNEDCHEYIHFNPRTPYGMRRKVLYNSANGTAISIHAPLTGCDIIMIIMIAIFYVYFNPRTPYGMRRA